MAVRVSTIRLEVRDAASAPLRRVAAEAQQVAAGLDRAHRSASAFEAGFAGGLAAQAFTRASDAVTGFARGIFGATAAQENFTVSMTRMLGSQAAALKLNQELAAFAAQTPFELPQVRRGTQLLSAMGFRAEELIPVFTLVGDTVAAFGEFSTERIEMLVTAMGRLRQGGPAGEALETLRRFGVGQEQLAAAGIRFSKSGEVLTDRVTNLNAVMTVLGRNQGQMAVLSQTLEGRWSTLKDELGETQRVLGGELLESTKAFVVAATEMTRRLNAFLAAGGAREVLTIAGHIARVAVAFVVLAGAIRLATLAMRLFTRSNIVLFALSVLLDLVLSNEQAMAALGKIWQQLVGIAKRLWDWLRSLAEGLKSIWDNRPPAIDILINVLGALANIASVAAALSPQNLVRTVLITIGVLRPSDQELAQQRAAIASAFAVPVAVRTQLERPANESQLVGQIEAVLTPVRLFTDLLHPQNLSTFIPAVMALLDPVRIMTELLLPTITGFIAQIEALFTVPVKLRTELQPAENWTELVGAQEALFEQAGALGRVKLDTLLRPLPESDLRVFQGQVEGALAALGPVRVNTALLPPVTAGGQVVPPTTTLPPVVPPVVVPPVVPPVVVPPVVLPPVVPPVVLPPVVGGGGGTGDTGQCFAAGTLVATPNGARPIDTLQVSDAVYRYDPTAGALVPTVVTRALVHTAARDAHLVWLCLDTGAAVVVTEGHHLLTPAGRWLPAGQLQPGDPVVWAPAAQSTTAPATSARVVLARPTTAEVLPDGRLYNLEVAAPDDAGHNYVVVGGLVAHNARKVMFAAGGLVTQPTLGLLGEAGPEAVIPLARASRGNGGRAAGGVTLNVTVQVADSVVATREGLSELAERIGAQFARKYRLLGAPALMRV